jgi:hypothetical protein
VHTHAAKTRATATPIRFTRNARDCIFMFAPPGFLRLGVSVPSLYQFYIRIVGENSFTTIRLAPLFDESRTPHMHRFST